MLIHFCGLGFSKDKFLVITLSAYMNMVFVGQVANMPCRLAMVNRNLRPRQFSVFNEFSKQLKGEAKRSCLFYLFKISSI